MNKVLLLSFLTIGFILAGLTTRNPILAAMAIPFVIYMLSGMVSSRDKPDIWFERSLSDTRVSSGMPVEITVTVHNPGPTIDVLLVEDKLSSKLTIENGFPQHLIKLGSKETRTWKYTVSGVRGFYLFNTIQTQSYGVLGIPQNRHSYKTSGQLLILPRILNLKGITIRPRKTRVYAGEIPSQSEGQGIEFLGVREYQPGDPPKVINWRASARNPSTLYANEFEQERVADVGLILDGRERSNTISTGASIFEYSVLAAASLASAFIDQGDRVSLLHYGKYLEWTFPGYGKIQRERILRALSNVEPGHSLVFEYLEYIPTQIFPPHSQIVLISPLTSDDPDVLIQIRARGYRLLIISPDPVIFEKSNLPETKETELAARILTIERESRIQRLLQNDIRVVNWDTNQPFDQVVRDLSRSPTIPRMIANI